MTVLTDAPANSSHLFPKIFLPSQRSESAEAIHPCKKLAKSFESATGWVLGFQESGLSQKANALAKQTAEGDSSQTSESEVVRLGTISITDMSADWPPRKPTASRRKCDELATAIHELVNELNRTKLHLRAAQNELSQHNDLVELEDALTAVDKLAGITDSLKPSQTFAQTTNQTFAQSESTIDTVSPPFEGWTAAVQQPAGSFARWFVNADEQLVVVCGRGKEGACATDSLLIKALVQVAQSSRCRVQEMLESLELILNGDLATFGVELVIAMIDPLAGEVNILRAGHPSDSSKQIPIYIDEQRVEDSDGPNGYFGFLSRGQSLTLGDQTVSKSSGRIKLSRN